MLCLVEVIYQKINSQSSTLWQSLLQIRSLTTVSTIQLWWAMACRKQNGKPSQRYSKLKQQNKSWSPAKYVPWWIVSSHHSMGALGKVSWFYLPFGHFNFNFFLFHRICLMYSGVFTNCQVFEDKRMIKKNFAFGSFEGHVKGFTSCYKLSSCQK